MLLRSIGRAAILGSIIFAASSPAYALPVTLASYFSASIPAIDEVVTTGGSTTLSNTGVDVFSGFGVNGIRVTTGESSAVSAWLDEWTVTGATGSGFMTIDWVLEGSLTVDAPPPVCTTCQADPAGITFRSLLGATSIFSAGTTIVSVSQDVPGTSQVSQSGSIIVPFVYGTQFLAGFRLSGGLGDDYYGGSVDFLNTAAITGIVLPAGATLVTTSGTAYPVSAPPPSSIPEPATLLLLGPALLGLAGYRWRAGRVRAPAR